MEEILRTTLSRYINHKPAGIFNYHKTEFLSKANGTVQTSSFTDERSMTRAWETISTK